MIADTGFGHEKVPARHAAASVSITAVYETVRAAGPSLFLVALPLASDQTVAVIFGTKPWVV